MKVVISENNIKVYKSENVIVGTRPLFDTVVLNAKLNHKTGYIEITGDEVMYEFLFYKERSNLSRFHKSNIKETKGLFGFFAGIKTVPKGWARLKETSKFKKQISNFKIEYMDI